MNSISNFLLTSSTFSCVYTKVKKSVEVCKAEAWTFVCRETSSKFCCIV